MALLFYSNHPWDLLTVQAHHPYDQIFSQPHHPHNSFLFLECPPVKELEEVFSHSSLYLNPNNPQDPIWMKDTHGTAFLRRTITYRITFSQMTTNYWKENNQPLPTPQKYSALPSKTPYFSSGTALKLFVALIILIHPKKSALITNWALFSVPLGEDSLSFSDDNLSFSASSRDWEGCGANTAAVTTALWTEKNTVLTFMFIFVASYSENGLCHGQNGF